MGTQAKTQREDAARAEQTSRAHAAGFHVVITDSEHGTIEPEMAVLSPLGVRLTLLDCKTGDDIIRQAADADVLIVTYARITGRVLDALPRCRLVTRYGIGVDLIDLAAATQRGVLVTNVPDYCLEEVANQTMAFLMALARKLTMLDRALREGRAVKDGRWNTVEVTKPIRRLSTQTLGIVGVGRIGRRVAQRVRPFGMRVVAVDPAVSAEEAAQWGATMLPSLEEMLPRVDYLTLHVPLLESTRHLIDAGRLALLKPGAVVINTSRGAVIEEVALTEALHDGRLAGAGIDVYEREPIAPDHPLCRMDHVILSSHAAWYSEEAQYDVKNRAAQAAADLFLGRIPEHVVNPEVLELPQPRWRG